MQVLFAEHTRFINFEICQYIDIKTSDTCPTSVNTLHLPAFKWNKHKDTVVCDAKNVNQ